MNIQTELNSVFFFSTLEIGYLHFKKNSGKISHGESTLRINRNLTQNPPGVHFPKRLRLRIWSSQTFHGFLLRTSGWYELGFLAPSEGSSPWVVEAVQKPIGSMIDPWEWYITYIYQQKSTIHVGNVPYMDGENGKIIGFFSGGGVHIVFSCTIQFSSHTL